MARPDPGADSQEVRSPRGNREEEEARGRRGGAAPSSGEAVRGQGVADRTDRGRDLLGRPRPALPGPACLVAGTRRGRLGHERSGCGTDTCSTRLRSTNGHRVNPEWIRPLGPPRQSPPWLAVAGSAGRPRLHTVVSRPKQVYKVAFPNGKIYVGQDRTGLLFHFGSPANLDQLTSGIRAAPLGAGPSRRRLPVLHHAPGGRRVLRACRTDTGMRVRRWPRRSAVPAKTPIAGRVRRWR